MTKIIEFIGKVSLFGLRVIADLFRRPFEAEQVGLQLAEIGSQSVPLIAASGFALGAVMTLHTRSTLVMFGATSEIPTVQSLAFFVEIGPLVAGLLLAGRVGSGIGAVLANMRVTEQIDGIESLSIDSFKFLVVPRVLACVIALPLLTLFMDCLRAFGGLHCRTRSFAYLISPLHHACFCFVRLAEFYSPNPEDGCFWFPHRNGLGLLWLHHK